MHGYRLRSLYAWVRHSRSVPPWASDRHSRTFTGSALAPDRLLHGNLSVIAAPIVPPYTGDESTNIIHFRAWFAQKPKEKPQERNCSAMNLPPGGSGWRKKTPRSTPTVSLFHISTPTIFYPPK